MFPATVQRDAHPATLLPGTNTSPVSLIDTVPGHPDADVKKLLRTNADTPGMRDAMLTVEQKAQVLSDTSASWPQNATVSLTPFTFVSPATEAARLPASSSSIISMALVDGVALSHQLASDLALQTTVQAVALLLAPDKTLQNVQDYLASPANTSLHSSAAPWVPSAAELASFDVGHKLRALRAHGASDQLIRTTVGQMLRTAPPDMAQAVVTALIAQSFPLWQGANAGGWHALANDVKRSWLSDGKPALVQNIDLRGTILAKAVGATTTTTTTTTTTSTTTTTGTTLAAPAGQATAAVGTEITIATAPERGAVSVIRLLQPSTRAWHKTLLTEALGMVKHPERVPEATREVQRTAMKALSRLLQGKPLNFAAMTTASQQSFADTLVQLKQWKLLRHLVPTHDRWEFNVTSPQIATGLASMAPWPSTTSTLCVTLSPTLAPQSIQEVGALFKTVPANRRRLSVWASAHSHASCWTALAALVNASPPSALSIKPTTENPASLQTIREFLSQALCDELGELCLLGIQEDNLKTIAGLVSVVGTSSLDKLELPACNDSLVEALAVCKPWASLGLDASPPVAAALKNKLVVTRALNLKIQTTNSVEKQAQQNTCILDIIGAAEKSVQRLRLWGAGIDLVDMVQILDRSRFITDVAFLPTKTSPEAGKSALVLLRQNLFIRSMTSSHSDFKLALDLALRRELNQVPLRNQHLSIQRGDAGPEEFSIGAVRGLASQWGGIPEDLAALIAPLLDGKSAQSLSVVNKATFIGSRQLWETGARRLTRVFVPAAKNTAAVAGLVPTPSKRNPFVLLVEDLLNMQVPYALISDALGRRIQELLPKSSAELEANPVLALEPALTQEELDTLPQLLEAMAYAGGMPPQLWLQKAVGINLKAA